MVPVKDDVGLYDPIISQFFNVAENIPDAFKTANELSPATQSSKVPVQLKNPKLVEPPTHLLNVPVAIDGLSAPPPNDPTPPTQSSNKPEAVADAAKLDDPHVHLWKVPEAIPEKEKFPPTQFLYMPEYSVALRIPLTLVPLNTQFSIYVRLNRSVAVPILPESLTVEANVNELASITVATVYAPFRVVLPELVIRTESPASNPWLSAVIVIVVPFPDQDVIAVALGNGKYAAVLPAPDPCGVPVRSIVTPLIFTSFAVW
jgi:hypothetical protein